MFLFLNDLQTVLFEVRVSSIAKIISKMNTIFTSHWLLNSSYRLNVLTIKDGRFHDSLEWWWQLHLTFTQTSVWWHLYERAWIFICLKGVEIRMDVSIGRKKLRKKDFRRRRNSMNFCIRWVLIPPFRWHLWADKLFSFHVWQSFAFNDNKFDDGNTALRSTARLTHKRPHIHHTKCVELFFSFVMVNSVWF